MELVVTFVIVAILGSVAVSYYRSATSDVDDSLARRTLESAASLQLAYQASRGEFATTPVDLSRISGDEVTLQIAASGSPAEVSVYDLGSSTLGLAVLSSPGRCLTLLVELSGPGEQTEVRDVQSDSQCVGQLAGS